MGMAQDHTDAVSDLAAERERFARRRLDECERALRAGNLLAVVDAIEFCAHSNCSPPSWLVGAVAGLVMRQMLARKGRGRFNSRQAVFNENMKHYTRWDMVTELRGRRFELYENWKDQRGLTLEKAYAAVAEELEGTPAAGGEEAIKYSYKLVEKRIAQGRGAELYTPRFRSNGKPG